MTVKLQKRLINVDEYHLMGEVGILKEKGIELIEGEIINRRDYYCAKSYKTR